MECKLNNVSEGRWDSLSHPPVADVTSDLKPVKREKVGSSVEYRSHLKSVIAIHLKMILESVF